uniref:Uncharacterized protein n=1 Tax=Myotis myotis TaxID=51298 RepID=A0A7J7VID1_MYOMY|nr:hypothetical protein mMyoMyo1_008333 [Myotis myotis]
MNARTELAPEGWGLGDVMRPAARGRRRGLPPPVTSWGIGAGLAGPPQCWGAGSPLRGATGRSPAPTGERGARGSRPAASRRGLRALSRAGRGGRRRRAAGGVCVRAENAGSLGSPRGAGARLSCARRVSPASVSHRSAGGRRGSAWHREPLQVWRSERSLLDIKMWS